MFWSGLITTLAISILIVLFLCLVTGIVGFILSVKNRNVKIAILSIIVLVIGLIPSIYLSYDFYLQKTAIEIVENVQAEVVGKEYKESYQKEGIVGGELTLVRYPEQYNVTLKYNNFQSVVNNKSIYNNDSNKVNVQLIQKKNGNKILSQKFITE